MTNSNIIHYRLVNQQITETKFKKVEELIRYMGAIQAQEYAVTKWSIGLRLKNLVDADVEKVFNEGKILRTHVMRPTWHFVLPEDIRWMLELTAPRIHKANNYRCNQLGVDKKLLNRCCDIITKKLEGDNFLTRDALNAELKKKKIIVDGQPLSHVMAYAELEQLICSGPRQGNQFTYALMDERAPKSKKTITRDQANVELALRYFTSRGPATIKDYVWWSGLTMKDAKEGIAALPSYFIKETINGEIYFFSPTSIPKNIHQFETSFLMPDYDEYGICYKDRRAIFSATKNIKVKFNRMIIIDGKIEGTWKRTIKNKSILIETDLFDPSNKIHQKKLAAAVKRFSVFVGKELKI